MNLNVLRKIPVIGIDDGSFRKNVDLTTFLVFVLLKELGVEAVRFTRITVDGLDATEKAIEVLKGLKFDAIMLAGVSFGGFNLIDPFELFEKFGTPVIVILKRRPRNDAIRKALIRHFNDWRARLMIIEKLGPIHELALSNGRGFLYFESVGADVRQVSNLINAFTVIGGIPEPVRVAKIIAHGISKL
ncbi:MAG: DUF99 family protein [Candidatus Bathyarchaeia archaeon]